MAANAYYTLNDGNKAPWVAYGTGTAHFGKSAVEPVKLALKAGLIHIDAAQVYENEDSVGEALSSPDAPPRSSLYITTKLGKLAAGEKVVDSLRTALSKLKIDYVDLYLVHFPFFFLKEAGDLEKGKAKLVEIWKGMEEVKALGLAKSIGVSNWRVKDFEAILPEATVLPAVNQIEYHPYVHAATVPILELHAKHNIITASYGGLSPLFRAGSSDPRYASTPAHPGLVHEIEAIKKRYKEKDGKDISDGQVLQLWLRARNVLVVTTSSKAERLQESLILPSLSPLTPEEVESIDKAGSKAHSRYFFTAPDQMDG